MNRAILIAVLLCFPVIAPSANADDPDDMAKGTFDRSVAKNGLTMTKAECRDSENSIWVVVGGQGDCVRYFHAGLEARNPVAHLFIHGDVDLNRYSASEEKLRNRVKREHDDIEMPHIWVSRPGIFGSSGHYLDLRRSRREALLVDSAISEIKRRHSIEKFHLSGQSSGGRLVALILSMRNDIGCAVIASAGLAQRRLYEMKGWRWNPKILDPMDRIPKISKDQTRRIFLMGDELDTVVPFEIQEAFHEALNSAGIRSLLINAKGRAKGQRYHQLAYLAHSAVSMCADGMEDAEIQERISNAPYAN